MSFLALVQRVAAARGGTAAIILQLPDGIIIACRDEWQAMMIVELWRLCNETAPGTSDGRGA